jgi:hypothetical protein
MAAIPRLKSCIRMLSGLGCTISYNLRFRRGVRTNGGRFVPPLFILAWSEEYLFCREKKEIYL